MNAWPSKPSGVKHRSFQNRKAPRLHRVLRPKFRPSRKRCDVRVDGLGAPRHSGLSSPMLLLPLLESIPLLLLLSLLLLWLANAKCGSVTSQRHRGAATRPSDRRRGARCRQFVAPEEATASQYADEETIPGRRTETTAGFHHSMSARDARCSSFLFAPNKPCYVVEQENSTRSRLLKRASESRGREWSESENPVATE